MGKLGGGISARDGAQRVRKGGEAVGCEMWLVGAAGAGSWRGKESGVPRCSGRDFGFCVCVSWKLFRRVLS